MNKFQINLPVRFRNKMFWIALIPAILVLIQCVCAIFGVTLDLTDLQAKLLDAVNAVFVLLTVLGVLNDPTTKGFSDSDKAMTYDEPKER